jgi:two-component system CAI-1 autoinducer sensor kinase/phosphatase CqsS
LKIKERFFNVLDFAETNLIVIGLLGAIGFPLYFFIWQYLFPQPYENVWLRMICSAAYIPWLFYSKFFRSSKSYFSIYLIFSLTLTLPYFFSFMLIKNDFSFIWAMSLLSALSLLITVVYDCFLVTAMVLGGFALAFLSVGGSVNIREIPLEFIPIFAFVFIACSLATHRTQIDRKLRIKHTKSLAGSIAHEMRNPLSQIHGAIHLLKNNNSTNNDEFHEYYEDVIDVIKNSHQIIDITMDAINEKPVNKQKFQLVSAVDICHEAVSSYAYKDAGLRNKVSVLGSDFQILVDPVLVKYILYNLIGNALYYVQHMPKAEIVISTFLATRQIQVRDTGPGIAPENLSKLFDSFYTSGKSGGTGLGLAYCKRTMQALDGEIYCESVLGEHTAFRMSFPDLAVPKQA